MAKRGGRRAFLGVQWDFGSWDTLPALCDLIIGTVGKRPLVWNFPALPPDSPKRSRTWLENTVGARRDLDIVATMGFAGACHPILSMDELEKELSWGVENPWVTGMSQLLGIHPKILMPRVPDLAREDALTAYGGHGFTTIGVPSTRKSIAWASQAGLTIFTWSRVSLGEPSMPVRAFQSRAGDTLLMLDLSSARMETLREELERLTPWLAPEGAPSPLSVAHPLLEDFRALAADAPDWSAFPPPLLRQALAGAPGGARKKRKKNEEYREILAGLSMAKAPDAREDSRPDALRGGSRLVAQMLGDVALAGNDFDVKLTGGRFTGIAKGGRDYLPTRPARSYLRVGGKIWQFHTRNSFSFEGDDGTGLREVLAIDSQEGASLSIEYSFCDDCPLLEITADVRWPVIPPGMLIDEHAPLVITLREMGRAEQAVIETEAPDGSTSSRQAAEGTWVLVPAALHRVNLPGGGTLLLRPGPLGTTGWNLASFRVVREGRKRFLEANPFGGWSPLPGAVLSGRRERFSLLVGIEA